MWRKNVEGCREIVGHRQRTNLNGPNKRCNSKIESCSESVTETRKIQCHNHEFLRLGSCEAANELSKNFDSVKKLRESSRSSEEIGRKVRSKECEKRPKEWSDSVIKFWRLFFLGAVVLFSPKLAFLSRRPERAPTNWQVVWLYRQLSISEFHECSLAFLIAASMLSRRAFLQSRFALNVRTRKLPLPLDASTNSCYFVRHASMVRCQPIVNT